MGFRLLGEIPVGAITGNGPPKFCFVAQVSLRDVKKKESKKEERRENSLTTTTTRYLYCNIIYGYTGYMVVLFST